MEKPIRLTKSGKPDKRSVTSKLNLEKGKKKVLQILEKAKGGNQNMQNTVDGYETDDEEYEIRPVKKGDDMTKSVVKIPEQITQTIPTPITPIPTTIISTPTPTISTPTIISEIKESQKSTDPYNAEELKKLLAESELTKKEVQELKKIIKDQQEREKLRVNNESQKAVDLLRQQAYGRLNSLSQQMSMKF